MTERQFILWSSFWLVVSEGRVYPGGEVTAEDKLGFNLLKQQTSSSMAELPHKLSKRYHQLGIKCLSQGATWNSSKGINNLFR